MNELRFYLDLSPERYLRYYRGTAKVVSVVSTEGRRLEFPAEHLRPFVTHEGIRGHFLIQFDSNNRFVSLKRMDEHQL